MNPDFNMSVADSSRNKFNKVIVVTAFLLGFFMLLGLVSLIISIVQPSMNIRYLAYFENNWLIKIFKLHTDFYNFRSDLYGFNILDVAILSLISILCLGFSTKFRKGSRIWFLIAFMFTLLGIILFVVTQLAGRSTLMLVVLIISVVILKNKVFSRWIIITGISASIFLLAGDLTVGIHSIALAILVGMGYVLLMTWFFLIGLTLSQTKIVE